MDSKVVVVTGASSGIGRAAATAFAARGDDVVLIARSASALGEVAEACRGLAGRTLVVPTDVTDEAAVVAAAERAVEEFGRIDAWINGASVWSFGRFEDTPSETFQRVVDTTFLGAVHGARAALPVFRAQGEGVLVNVASIYGHLSTPYLTSYVASKWGLIGLSHALRQELVDSPDIHVCIVSPGATDTPIYRHAANYVGRAIRPPPPVLPAERVASAIVRVVDRPRREVIVGRVQRSGITAQRLAPGVYDALVGPVFERAAVQRSSVPVHPGNVFEPSTGGEGTDDGWRRSDLRTASKASLLGLGAVGAVRAVVGITAARRRRQMQSRR